MTKKKVKWSFLVESDAENMEELNNDFMHDGWEIPNDCVIGISRLEDSDEDKAE